MKSQKVYEQRKKAVDIRMKKSDWRAENSAEENLLRKSTPSHLERRNQLLCATQP